VSLGVRLSRCVCVRRISLDDEGNALYPVLSSFSFFVIFLPSRHSRCHVADCVGFRTKMYNLVTDLYPFKCIYSLHARLMKGDNILSIFHSQINV